MEVDSKWLFNITSMTHNKFLDITGNSEADESLSIACFSTSIILDFQCIAPLHDLCTDTHLASLQYVFGLVLCYLLGGWLMWISLSIFISAARLLFTIYVRDRSQNSNWHADKQKTILHADVVL